jgi:hypothetical protein
VKSEKNEKTEQRTISNDVSINERHQTPKVQEIQRAEERRKEKEGQEEEREEGKGKPRCILSELEKTKGRKKFKKVKKEIRGNL